MDSGSSVYRKRAPIVVLLCSLIIGTVVAAQDATDPVIGGFDLPDTEQFGSPCSVTIPFSATISDETCITEDDVLVGFGEADEHRATFEHSETIIQSGSKTVLVEGSITVSDLCEEPQVTFDFVISVQDCAGNGAFVIDSVIISNPDTPDAAPAIDFPEIDDITLDINGEATIDILATAGDCCLWRVEGWVDDVSPTLTVAGTLTEHPWLDCDETEVQVTGSLLVTDVGHVFPAQFDIWIHAQSDMSCGESFNNADVKRTVTVVGTLADITAPTVSGFELPRDTYITTPCTVTIPYSATVTDDRCIDAADVTVEICRFNIGPSYELATPEIEQVDSKTVAVSGTVTVSDIGEEEGVGVGICLTADDCSGNQLFEGAGTDIWDEMAPVIDFPEIGDFPLDASGEAVIPISVMVNDCCLRFEGVTASVASSDATVTDQMTVTLNPFPDEFDEITGYEVGGSIKVESVQRPLPAEVDITIDAMPCFPPGPATLTRTVTLVDSTPPTIDPADPQLLYMVDGSCAVQIPVSANVWDNFSVLKDDVTVTVTPTNATVLSNDITYTQSAQNLVIVGGSVTVHALSECAASVELRYEAADESGNVGNPKTKSTTTSDMGGPTISFPDPADVTTDGNCAATIVVSATVTDNCGLSAGDVSVTVTPPGNAAVVDHTTVTQTNDTTVSIGGTIAVSDLTSCPATVGIEISATDDCGMPAAPVTQTVDVIDPVAPVIDFPDPADVAVDGNCEVVIPVSATVTDNCGIDADDVSVTLATFNVSGMSNDITITQGATDRIVVIGGSITVGGLTDCPASATIGIEAIDHCGQQSNETQIVGVFDNEASVISFTKPDDATVDGSCEATIPVTATITDNCCIAPGNVTVTVTPTNVSVKSNDITVTQGATNDIVNVVGSITLEELTGCPAKVEIKIEASDCCGGVAAIPVTQSIGVDDDAAPVIVFAKPADVIVDGSCEVTIPISGTVTDNCCVFPGSVTVNVTPTNVVVLSNDITKTQGATDNTASLGGSITVHRLTDCPADVEFVIEAIDCCGENTAPPVVWTVNVDDDEGPRVTINYLRPVDGDGRVDECCEEVMEYQATVTDNCCIDPARVSVGVTATNAETAELAVTKVPTTSGAGVDTVVVSGTYVVKCLTACPATTELTVTLAEDCCHNPGANVVATKSYDTIRDVTAPEPNPDPLQTSYESDRSDELEVRLDEYGIYRLIIRENTPKRIDVIANDDDNCSLCGCCGTMWIDAITDEPDRGTASIPVNSGDCNGGSEIRYAPDHAYTGPDSFKYTIRDACNNVSAEVTVYVQVVPSVLMEDVSATACSGEPAEIRVAASDLWVDRDPVQIPFGFEIVSGPSHGVVYGDLTQIGYTPPSTITDPNTGELVPTLDFVEAAAVGLTYTSAIGLTGRDTITVRFNDPFGAFSSARADILVTACEAAESESIEITAGATLPMIMPLTFATVVETTPGAMILMSVEDGMAYPETLTAIWSDELERHILLISTAELPLGPYRLTAPLGNGERVELSIEILPGE